VRPRHTTEPFQIGDAPKPPPTDQIPPEQIGPLVAAHYRGLGFMEQYDYREADEAFREVHDPCPGEEDRVIGHLL
jgi:hypothetical protein